MKKLSTIFLILAFFGASAQSLDTTFVKNLEAGWNLVGYLGDNPQAVEEALADILPYVEQVKNMNDYYASSEINEFLNTLDSLVPLEGYLIKVSQPCVLERTIRKSLVLYHTTESDPVFAASPASNITNEDIESWNTQNSGIDTSNTNELQVLSISNDTIYLSSGGYVKLPPVFSGGSLRLQVDKSDISCFGRANGSIAIVPSGGTAPYSVQWNGVIGELSRSDLSAGNFELYVEDASGLTAIKRVKITEPSQLSVLSNVTDVMAGDDGSIEISVSGGTPFSDSTYTYQWGDGAETALRSNLSAGLYSVTITDSLGCRYSADIALGAVAEVNEGDIIITEIMYDPNAVSDTDGEWIELYNTSGNTIFAEDFEISVGTSTFQIDLAIDAGGYVIIAKNANIEENGNIPADYEGNFSLANTTKTIQLLYNGSTIDEVTYNDSELNGGGGKSISLLPEFYNHTDNDSMTSWEVSTTEMPNGDFGTPGE